MTCKQWLGKFGGSFVPEILVQPLAELSNKWEKLKNCKEFMDAFHRILKEYAGRATPLTEVRHFAATAGNARIVLKREDLLHTGAHKLNNSIGQCLIAKSMGKTRVIAETGAGQHGVATATACAYLGLTCVVYMGEKDIERQAPNVAKMQLLGAEVIPVGGSRGTLKDAVNEALRDYGANYESTHYCLGSALGPYPYPDMVATFQQVIGEEAKKQCKEQFHKDPSHVIACIGGGSNAIGIFSGFIENDAIELIGVEGGGISSKLGEHAARFSGGRPGVLHGCYSYLLQDEEGQIASTHSISAGLDYPMIGPHHAALYDTKRARYVSVTDDEARFAMELLAREEGIIPALESAHALAYALKLSKTLTSEDLIIINLSGRGDKDL